MTKDRNPPAGKDADLSTAFKLTERLMNPSGQAPSSPPDAPAATETLGQNVRYWLWRAGGRKRPALNDPAQVARLFDNYEVEYERLKKAHEVELVKQRALHDQDLARLKIVQESEIVRVRAEAGQDAARNLVDMQAELAKERARIAELEGQTNDLMRAHDTELARSRAEGVAELERRLVRNESDHGEAMARLRAELESQAAARQDALAAQAATRQEALAVQAATRQEALAVQAATRQEALAVQAAARQDELAAQGAAREAELAAQGAAWEAEATRRLADGEARISALMGDLDQLRDDHAQALIRVRTEMAADAERAVAVERARVVQWEEATEADRVAHVLELARLRDDLLAQVTAERAHAAELEAAHAGELAATIERLREDGDRVLALQVAHSAGLEGGLDALRADHAAAVARLTELVGGHERAVTVERERVAVLERQLEAIRRERLEEAARSDDEISAEAVRARQDSDGALATAQARIAKLERERKSAETKHAKELAALREEVSAQSARARAEGMAVADSALRKASVRAAEAEQVAQALRAELAEPPAKIDTAELVEARRRIVELTREAQGRLADRDDEIGRLRAEHTSLQRELAAVRGHIAEMELSKPRKGTSNAELEARLAAALARGTQAEDALRVANNKVELLKDALEGAKARAVLPGPGPVGPIGSADTRFREAKRAFARQFHPDQGGRDDPQKERLFMEFWPVLEKIDREG